MTDRFGDRMKAYESASENVLTSRLPVILRLDGNSFSKLTSKENFVKPFDVKFEMAMEAAATAVLSYCSGAKVGYVQSDEITILLRNDQTHETTPFLANRTQKLASLTASTAAVAFNRAMAGLGVATEAIFDCRAFVVPPTEVHNVFLWRQLDAFKNSVSSYAYWELAKRVGRKTAQKLLHGKNTAQRQEVIFQELGVNFNDLPTDRKRGRCIYRETYEMPINTESYAALVTRSRWKVDRDIPLFNQDRYYIERFMDNA